MSFDDELGNVAEYDPGDPDYEPGTGYGNCSGCGDWHRPPWCADVDDLDVASTATRNSAMTTPIDMATGWSCTTGASLIAEATSPGPGSLPRLHAVIYVCQAHRADAEARITAAGYTPDVEDAPPSHRWDPWACGHITVYEEMAAARLGNGTERCADEVKG